jgi:hypothetical protein
VRGASALDQWVAAHPGVEAFIVWEPVLDGDVVPDAAKLVRHGHNYWDPERTRSAVMKRSGAEPGCLVSGSAELDVVWDAVFEYAPGAERVGWCGRTIVGKLGELR